MKRKRGKKGKKGKGLPRPAPPSSDANEAAVNLVSLLKEDNSGGDDYDGSEDRNSNGNDAFESRMDVDTPSSTGTDQPLNVANIKPDGSVDKAVGKSVGRVKVKLKTSKKIDSQSDTDKSSPQRGLDQKGGASDKIEDSGNSLPVLKVYVSGSRKPGSIKIKPSKLVDLTAENSGDDVVTRDQVSQQKEVTRDQDSRQKEVTREQNSLQKEVSREQESQQKEVTQEQGSQQKEPSTPRKASRYSKQELDVALSVIKKVMKMDAAEPFNVPVNPEALGIPDYFDIIDTPMDFGTICSNLEKGDKYKNSEDVYKDVQYIWDNCFKYNSKGDYILDLMKRVRKNFLKYWTAAELYTEPGSGPNGAVCLKGEVAAASSQVPAKSVQPKQKTKKRHGRRHKHDCLCAICVLKRRRREREENARLAKGQIVGDKKIDQHLKQDESSLAESPGGGESSSNMGESQDADADSEVEGKAQDVKADVTEGKYSHVDKKQDEEEDEDEEEEENDVDIHEKGKLEKSVESQYADTTLEEPNRESQSRIAQSDGSGLPSNRPEGSVSELHEEMSAVQQTKQKELQGKKKRAKILEEFQFENPLLRGLCGSLFPENHSSIWSGPHSLVHHKNNDRRSSIHAAIEELMK